MFISFGWQSKIALLIALGMTSTATFPLLLASSATASSEPYVVGQLLSQSGGFIIPAGTVLPVRYDEAERIVLKPDEKLPVTLTVAETIRAEGGEILVPAGSEIEGTLQPAGAGTQFVARELRLRGSDRSVRIRATSPVITEREIIKKGTDTGQVLKGAAVGAAAAAVIAEIVGGIDVEEVLGGAGIGALAGLLLGRRGEVEVIVVNTETDLDLTLQSDLRLPY
ncbi:MAG TPA: hypothetical protein V6C91_19755 [Coleofasciculaceae cyanobacterium]